MALNDTILKDMTTAMKEQNKFDLSVLRMLKSALQLEKINLKHDLSDEEVMVVIKRQVKQRKDSITEFEKYGKTEEVANLNQEVEVLSKYLPEELSEEEVEEEPKKDGCSVTRGIKDRQVGIAVLLTVAEERYFDYINILKGLVEE